MLENIVLPILVTVLVIAMIACWALYCFGSQKAKGGSGRLLSIVIVVIGVLVIALTVVKQTGLLSGSIGQNEDPIVMMTAPPVVNPSDTTQGVPNQPVTDHSNNGGSEQAGTEVNNPVETHDDDAGANSETASTYDIDVEQY